MKRFKGLISLFIFMMVLGGCTHSVEKLTQNEELRREILSDCQKMPQEKRESSQNCKNAADAEILALRNKVKSLFK